MPTYLRPIELLKSIQERKNLSGQNLIREFKALPKVSPLRPKPGFDDKEDIHRLLLSMTDEDRINFGIGLSKAPMRPAPTPPSRQPLYQVRVHAILCANDDGSGGAASPNAVDANYLTTLIETTNIIYKSAGIQFLYNPATDFERLNSSLLNLDFTAPSSMNLKLPETQPPLTDSQIADLGKPHGDERQRVGRLHRHMMVLLFCDGNMLVYDKNQGSWTIITRTYAFSGSDLEFVALPTGKGDLQSFANLVAHETGHYYHQSHTHYSSPNTKDEAATIIKNSVEKGEYSIEDGLKVFDGDRLTDTPPDASNGLFATEYGSEGCGSQGEVKITVMFSGGKQKEYTLKPDRANVMSYFKHCLNFTMHFSEQQIKGMRKSLEDENRWHLVHPSMRLKTLGTFVINNQTKYFAVWIPGEEPEIQVYGWTYDKMRAKYDELWGQGWRLHILNTYVVNNQPLYNAVWRPGSSGEIQVYGWPYDKMRAKYDELWGQGWRLHILNTYVVNNQPLYNAVWRPGSSGEIQVYGWPYDKMRAKYDELWGQGWRLHILNTYVVNNQPLYNAVWRPGSSGEIQVYGWPYDKMRAKYDELWGQGWRLHILNTYVVNDQPLYNAVWRPGSSGEIQVYGWPYDDYRALYDRMW